MAIFSRTQPAADNPIFQRSSVDAGATEEPDETYAAGAFGRSAGHAAFQSVPDLIYLLMKKAGLPVIDKEKLGKTPFEEQAGDTQHPIATTLGELAGDPLSYIGAGGAMKAGKTIPKRLSKLGDLAPILKSIEGKPYGKLEAYLKKHGIGEGIKVNPESLSEAKRLLQSQGIELPEEAIKRAFENVGEGAHKPLFNIQSSVRTAGRNLSKRGGVEAELGSDMHKLADEIMGQMKSHYEEIGHPKASELMTQGKMRSARYHKIKPYRNKAAGLAAAYILPKWLASLIRPS